MINIWPNRLMRERESERWSRDLQKKHKNVQRNIIRSTERAKLSRQADDRWTDGQRRREAGKETGIWPARQTDLRTERQRGQKDMIRWMDRATAGQTEKRDRGTIDQLKNS